MYKFYKLGLCRDTKRREEDIDADCQQNADGGYHMAVLPRCQINCADILNLIRFTGTILIEPPHNDQFDREQDGHCIQVVNRVFAARIAGLEQQECAIAHHVENGDHLGGVLGDVLEHKDTQNGAQHRQGNELAHGVQEGGDTACVHDKRSNYDGYTAGNGAVDLTDLYALDIGCRRIDRGPVQVEGEHCRGRVQYRVERGQDRAEHNRSKEAHNRCGNDFGNQSRIGKVDRRTAGSSQLVLNGGQVEGDETRDNQIQRAEALKEAAEDRTLLTFLQALGSQCTLYKGLVGAPPVQVVEEHTGDDKRPRYFGFGSIPSVDGVQLGRIGFNDVADAVHDAVAAGGSGQCGKTKEGDHQTADDQADAVDRIGYGNCLQTAENRIAAADNANDQAENSNSDKLAGAEHTGDIKDLFEHNCTGIQDDRQVEDGIHNNDDQREHGLGAPAVTGFHQGRDRHGTHLEEAGQEVVGQYKKCEHGADFPCDRAHVGLPALSVQTDELLSGEVGQQQGTGNHNA